MSKYLPKIALLSGSNRDRSINKQLVLAVEEKFAQKGVQTTVIDLADYPMPMLFTDVDVPRNAKRFAQNLAIFDGVFIATPEYNGAPPAILKNLIDWTSMLGTDHFTKPIYAVGSATPGPMSGIMAMQHLHYILGRLGATLVPIQVGTGNAKSAFDGNGHLKKGIANDLADQMVEHMLTRIHDRHSFKKQKCKA